MKLRKAKFYFILSAAVLFALNILSAPSALAKLPPKTGGTPDYYQPYLTLLKDVYEKMDQYYYQPVSKGVYELFVDKYKKDVLSKLKPAKKRINQIAYIGAGLLVNHLKAPEDTFTNFIPPKIAKKYAQKVYGYSQGIGITGQIKGKKYLIDYVERRSDSYKQGIRKNDLIISIENQKVSNLSLLEIDKLLHPALGKTVSLDVIHPNKKPKHYLIKCEEFFRETITPIPTNMPKVFCLKISSFNKETANDLKDYVRQYEKDGISLLIIDLEGNPGGPPLAVYEISGIFMPEHKKLFYYKKRNKPVFGMSAPESDVKYTGPLVILINSKSGSAAELFTGTFKAYKRALIAGKEPTAGRAFLKTTFSYDDGAMLAMVIGFAYLTDGTKFGLKGVPPSLMIPKEEKNDLMFVLDKYKKKELPLP